MGHGSSRLLINEQPLQVLPSLAKEIGLDEAIFLQQVHYWLTGSKHEDQGRFWIFNSYEEWHEQLPFFSLRKLERIVTELKKRGLLLVRQASGFDRKNWYSIDYEAFKQITKACAIEARSKRRPCRQMGGIDPAKMAASDGAKMAASYTESPESPLETPAPRLSPGDFNKRLMAYHQQHIVGRIPNGGKQGVAIKQLYDDGFSPEDCEAVYDALRGDKWRKGRVDWATVRGDIGTRLPILREVAGDSSGDDEFGANRPARSFATPEEFADATGKPLDEVKANWDGANKRSAKHAPAA